MARMKIEHAKLFPCPCGRRRPALLHAPQLPAALPPPKASRPRCHKPLSGAPPTACRRAPPENRPSRPPGLHSASQLRDPGPPSACSHHCRPRARSPGSGTRPTATRQHRGPPHRGQESCPQHRPPRPPAPRPIRRLRPGKKCPS